ncbi:MAG: helix-turn-helix domain-containing protein [Verrucomicrobia bacterium]|nr:helix-turn-helix domain-containing protein [Verrucomicrobiota bacterium]
MALKVTLDAIRLLCDADKTITPMQRNNAIAMLAQRHLTLAQTCAALNKSRMTVYRRVKDGLLNPIRINRSNTLYDAQEVAALVATNRPAEPENDDTAHSRSPTATRKEEA